MGKLIELEGKRFGRWVVLRRVKNIGRYVYWSCRCDCGTERDVMGIHLRSEASRSCGCLSVEACKKRIGENHHRWRGGKYINEAGYVIISEPGGPAFYEHVAVLEKEIGRKLNKGGDGSPQKWNSRR